MSGTSAADAVTQIVSAMLNFGGPNAVTGELGGKLLMGLTVIAIAWTALKVMMEGEGVQKLIAEMLTILFLWGFASMFVNTGPDNWGGKLMSGFEGISNSMLAAGSGGGEITSPEQAIMIALGNSLTVAGKMFQEPSLTGDNPRPPGGGSSNISGTPAP